MNIINKRSHFRMGNPDPLGDALAVEEWKMPLSWLYEFSWIWISLEKSQAWPITEEVGSPTLSELSFWFDEALRTCSDLIQPIIRIQCFIGNDTFGK